MATLRFSKSCLYELAILLRKKCILWVAQSEKHILMCRDHSSKSIDATARSGTARCRAATWAAPTLLLLAFMGSIPKAALGKQTQTNVEALLEQARGEENAGNYIAAENTYKQALAAAPENLEILKRLADLEQTELKFDDSIRPLKQWLAADQSCQVTNSFLGLSNFVNNEFLP